MFTRREFGAVMAAGLAWPRLTRRLDPLTSGPGPLTSGLGGVRIGVQTYSFRDMTKAAPPASMDAIDIVTRAMTECGLSECELYSPQVEPTSNLRAWRLETPLDHFKAIRQRFEASGLSIFAYNLSFNDRFSEEEIDRGFDMARALGAEIITASSTLSAAKRVAPFAERHKMVVAMHGHSNVKDQNEFATPASFEKAMAMSKYFKINLDIGHFTAANFDAVAFIREHHVDITNLHLKDRRKNQGDNVPWGQGDTPIREVLQLLATERWPIRAYIEYEYDGTGTPTDEVKKCFEYVKQALA
jgi:sugar phosphate isomerase/epimerase